MDTVVTQHSGKPNWATRRFACLLRYMLPRKGRRAIFLTTLFMEISKISPEHKQALEELNRHLGIVENIDSLKLPAALHKAIWKDHDFVVTRRNCGGSEINEEQISGIAHRAIREMPQWAHYGDYEQVFNDTREVIKAYIEWCRKMDCKVPESA